MPNAYDICRFDYFSHKVLEVFHKTEDDFRKMKEMELKFAVSIKRIPVKSLNCLNML